MWSSPDVVGLFSNNVVSFSRNVVLRDPLFSLNSVSKPLMLSVRADYVLSSPQVASCCDHDSLARPKIVDDGFKAPDFSKVDFARVVFALDQDSVLNAGLLESPENIDLMGGSRPPFDFDVMLNFDVLMSLFHQDRLIYRLGQ
jgi:hypothetical protein